MSKGVLHINVSNPGFLPMKRALDAYVNNFADHRDKSCSLEISPPAAVTLEPALRKINQVPQDATTYAVAFPLGIDSSLLDQEADLSFGHCLLPLRGGFVYFDRHLKVVAINSFHGVPNPDHIPQDAAFLQFEKPLLLPQVAREALKNRWRPVTLKELRARGAMAFTWIGRGEALPGIESHPPPDGAFAYVLKGGRSIYFPVQHYDTGVRPKLSEIHDFSFSRGLWLDVCKQTFKRAALLILLYIFVGYYAICKAEGWDSATSWYFLSTTFTTVGYGDFAPTKQSTRAIAIGILPLGLIIVGFLISASQAYQLSKPSTVSSEDPLQAVIKAADPKQKQKALEKLVFEHAALVDVDEDGKVCSCPMF
jgi:voltage-gated potassium channel Kch